VRSSDIGVSGRLRLNFVECPSIIRCLHGNRRGSVFNFTKRPEGRNAEYHVVSVPV
jgi:hypothetical protein